MLRFISDFDWIYLAVFEQLYVSLQQTQKKTYIMRNGVRMEKSVVDLFEKLEDGNYSI